MKAQKTEVYFPTIFFTSPRPLLSISRYEINAPIPDPGFQPCQHPQQLLAASSGSLTLSHLIADNEKHPLEAQ
jgi:hypothetical protein